MSFQKWGQIFGMVAGLAIAVSAGAQDPLAVVEIRGLDRLAADVQTLSGTFGQELPAEAVFGFAGQALGAPMLEGIDTSGVIRIVIPSQELGGEPPDFAILLPLTDDGTALTTALSSSMEATAEANGIRTFTSGPDAPPMQAPELRVMVKPGLGILGMTAEAVAFAAAMPPGKIDLNGTVAVNVDVQALMAIVEPKITAQTEEMREMFEAMQEAGEAGDEAPMAMEMNPADILQSEVELFSTFAKQLAGASFGLSAHQGALRIYSGLDPAAGSTFASCLAEARPAGSTFQAALPTDALFAQTGFFPCMDEMMTPYMEWVVGLYDDMGPTFAPFSEMMKRLINDLDGLYPGDYAIAVLPGADGGIPAFVEVLAVADMASFKSMMKDMMDAQMSVLESNAIPGYSFTISNATTRTHRDVEVETWNMSMEFDETVAMGMPPPLVEWMKNFHYDIAYLDDAVVYTFGESSVTDATIDRILDGGGTPVPDSASFRSLFGEVGEVPIDAFQLSLFEIMRAIKQAIPEEAAANLPEFPEGAGPFAGHSVVRNGALRSTAAMQLSDLAALVQMGQQAAAAMMPAMPPSGVPGAAPSCEDNMRQLAILCIIYENSNGALPTDWDALKDFMYSPEPGLPKVLLCPEAETMDTSSYRMVLSGKISDIENPTTTVLIEEIGARHDGKRWAAYADGHVELVE